MQIGFVADGSAFTEKAPAFPVTHENLADADDEVFVLTVQPPPSANDALMVRSDAANDSKRDDASRVLDLIKLFPGRRLRSASLAGQVM